MGDRLTTDYRAKVYDDDNGAYVEIGDDGDALDLCDITYRETGSSTYVSIVIGWPHAEAVARAILKLCEARAAHRSRDGRLHGHTWEVTAWWPYGCCDALGLQARLGEAVARFDHGLLPDDLAWGEAIARHVGEELGCVTVDVSRPAERIYARWEA